MKLHGLIASLIAAMASVASAAPAVEHVTFLGTAFIAGEKRPTRITFACSASGRDAIGGLSVTIRVPLGSRPGFDFEAFEGPSGTGRALTFLSGRSGGRAGKGSFAASGGYQDDNSFSLTVSAARDDPRRLHALGDVLAPLLDPGTFTWRQSGMHPGAPGFSAELRLRTGGAARLSPTLSMCVAEPKHLSDRNGRGGL